MGSRQTRSVTSGKGLALKIEPVDLLALVLASGCVWFRLDQFGCFGSHVRFLSRASSDLLRTGADEGNPTV